MPLELAPKHVKLRESHTRLWIYIFLLPLNVFLSSAESTQCILFGGFFVETVVILSVVVSIVVVILLSVVVMAIVMLLSVVVR